MSPGAKAQTLEAGTYCGTSFTGIAPPAPRALFSGATVKVPVFFHVILSSDGTRGAVTDAQIIEQVDILNSEFAINSVAPPGHRYEFELVGISRTRNDDWFWIEGLHDPQENPRKAALSVDPARVANIYTLDLPSISSGYAFYPFAFEGPAGDGEDDYRHAIVLDYEFLPGGGGAIPGWGGPLDLGILAVHEMGHYLGLYHTFEWECQGSSGNSSCSTKGDEVCDTPQHAPTEKGTCPSSAPTGCTNQNPDFFPKTNFMNYTNDLCRFEFTDGQRARMAGMVETYRPTMFASSGGEVFPGGSITVGANQEWRWYDVAVRFGLGEGMVVESGGTLEAYGTRFSDTGQGWDGVAVSGTLTADGATVKHAETGVTVYEPGTATIANSTLRHNTVGLDVLSAGGTTVSGSTITDNGTGIRSGVPQSGPGAPVACFGLCRSALWLSQSEVVANTGHGVHAISVDAQIDRTEMSDNGGSGLLVADATIFPFFENYIERNGGGANLPRPDGVLVLAAGNVNMISPQDDPYGLNRLADNGGSELAVASGGTAFVGTHSLSTTPNDGRNSIYDRVNGGVLFKNNSGAVLYAGNTYWDHLGGPPVGAITGTSIVKASPASDCDYTVSPSVCLGARGTSGDGLMAEASEAGRSGEELRAEILAVRGRLVQNPAAEDAPGLVRTLAALHRRDRDDETGEYAASWGLLRSLRARLNGSGEPNAALRPVAEAALEAEAVEALTQGEHGQARDLVGMAPLAEDGDVGRVLRLVEAHLEVAEGRYAEAAAIVEAVAAEEAAEGDPESGVAEALLDLGVVFAERAGEGSGERGTGTTRLAEAETARGTESSAVRGTLAVYPNPAAATVTVALSLDEASDVRVAVYDLLGRQVALLAEGTYEVGAHRFMLDGSDLPAGVYLVRTERGEHRATERITLLR